LGEGVCIRAVERGDLAVLLAMVVALTQHHGDVARVTLESLERDFLGPVAWYHGLVAVQDGTVVGYAAALPLGRLGYGARGLDLHHLFVSPDARLLGVGRALVRGVEDLGRNLGCSYVIIGTHPDNVAAQAFYQHLGYGPHASTGKRFTKPLV
jgi:GNAT superfamily N-acetyltransferase